VSRSQQLLDESRFMSFFNDGFSAAFTEELAVGPSSAAENLPARKSEPPLRAGLSGRGLMGADLRSVLIGLAIVIIVFAIILGVHSAGSDLP
jgi:hypothetical protein